MAGRASLERRSAGERLVAWLVTGPLGHLAAFLVDAGAAWARWARGAMRRRLARGRSRG